MEVIVDPGRTLCLNRGPVFLWSGFVFLNTTRLRQGYGG